LKLYNFPWGPYPRRVTHYLAEKRVADIELIEVEFPHQPQRWPPGFLRGLSPAATLPVLDAGEDTIIGQSIAILEYLEETYPNPNMIGKTRAARAATRELVAVLDEATTFFGIWARHGSRLNVDRHRPSAEAAAVGAEGFSSRLLLAEGMSVGGPFIAGDSVTIADCVAMALLQFVNEVYGVSIPSGCPKLSYWYEQSLLRFSVTQYTYPSEILRLSYGLPGQTQLTATQIRT
jgi:glutathione S-transferase